MILASTPALSRLLDVFTLFLVPIGGGIPAGVLLAQKYRMAWPIMMGLYAASDMVLACIFEPLMLMFVRGSKSSERLSRVRDVLSLSIKQITARYGVSPRPFTLIMLTFGTDPMTGRVLSRIAGHGFFVGWLLTIAGDLIFFSVVMVSTLWLNNVLGDGTVTVTAIVVTVLVLLVPGVVRKLRERFSKKAI